MLILEGLTYRQTGFSLTADFSLEENSITALLGPSGAGKSTLLSLIAGYLAPTSGRVLWKGKDITSHPPAKRPISMLFQDNNLFPHLSARENVGLGLDPGLRLGREDWQRVEGVLARVGLAGLGERKPGQLSGGQIARVALARVMLRHRPLLLLDEPFSALGPALRAEMLGLVKQFADETSATILLVSHIPDDARMVAQTVVLVANGAAAAPVPTDELFLAPPPALEEYLGRRPFGH